MGADRATGVVEFGQVRQVLQHDLAVVRSRRTRILLPPGESVEDRAVDVIEPRAGGAQRRRQTARQQSEVFGRSHSPTATECAGWADCEGRQRRSALPPRSVGRESALRSRHQLDPTLRKYSSRSLGQCAKSASVEILFTDSDSTSRFGIWRMMEICPQIG